MKLLLDEMYDHAIAEQLRARGHDVVAVTERQELRGVNDDALLRAAAAEHRAILTENAAHFVPALAASGEITYGVLFTSPRSMPRGARTVGLFVRALARYLEAHQDDGALRDRAEWLDPA